MSKLSGDTARFNKIRKRRIQKRARTRQLRAALKEQKPPSPGDQQPAVPQDLAVPLT
jgi:hypothetical protein